MPDTMPKEQLLQRCADTYEEFIATARDAAQRGVTHQAERWGPRETVAHMAGWEVMASVRIPAIVAGMPPAEFANKTQQTVMSNAINAAFVTLMGDQEIDALCGMLRQSYQHNVALLKTLEETLFRPGEYVYERTKSVIEHCQEHMEMLADGVKST